MPLKLGQPLPEITLKQGVLGADGKVGLVDVNLRRNVGKGKTVILFVPLAFTGVCTDELCKVTGLLDEYKKLGADVIAISVDSPFAQEAWAKQAGIGLTLASDFNRVALKAFKVKDTRVIPEKTGLLNVAKRSVFVADKAGNVIHSEVKRDPSSMPNFAKIKKAVEA
jgi:peroxiredoxin